VIVTSSSLFAWLIKQWKTRTEAGRFTQKKDVVRGGIICWGLGVVTTLLFAPKSGQELRGDISNQAG
jgi:hypothetical protein